jgi:putative ABC transport system substrate-binding protein
VSDPVASGIVPRLNRPGGNITGFATFEPSLGGKWLELLSEIAPGLQRAAIMFNPDTVPVSAFVPSFETAARSLKVVAITAPVPAASRFAPKRDNGPFDHAGWWIHVRASCSDHIGGGLKQRTGGPLVF